MATDPVGKSVWQLTAGARAQALAHVGSEDSIAAIYASEF